MDELIRLPRVIVAGTHSGVGKTTIVAGICRALVNRGLTIQPFKTGPDYIDPGHHTVAARRECRNLDTMLVPDRSVRELFARGASGADLSIIEGVMGLFDGASADNERGSAGHLAKILRAPVILIIDVRAVARSAAAIVAGFARFDRSVRVAGVICNRVGSERHWTIVRDAISTHTAVPVLGYLPRSEELSLPARHLGLVPAWEKPAEQAIEHAAQLVERHIDLDRLLATANEADPLPDRKPRVFAPVAGVRRRRESRGVRIAYAYDDAFHFYYRDNLDILEHHSAELVPTSPLGDPTLPHDVDMLYIGGGFPELSAQRLSANSSYIESVRSMIEQGFPVYAECGGLMYLVDSLVTADGSDFAMAGIIPGQVRMDKKLRALGYCTAMITSECLLGKAGARIPGHVFHWSYFVETARTESAIVLEKGDGASSAKGAQSAADGFVAHNVLAGYLHVHFGSSRSIPARLVRAAANWRKNK